MGWSWCWEVKVEMRERTSEGVERQKEGRDSMRRTLWERQSHSVRAEISLRGEEGRSGRGVGVMC